MLGFAVTALVSYIAWLAITFPLVLSLNVQNLISGVFVALCVAIVSSRFLFYESPLKALNPKRWAYFIGYLFVLLYAEIAAHLDVAYRVITGRIEPGIVRARPSPKSDIGKTLFGASITLTPGTLIISADNELYLHSIHYKKAHETSDLIGKITRRITE
jgi:multicomponent Na+:H+ antiporter subunit E